MACINLRLFRSMFEFDLFLRGGLIGGVKLVGSVPGFHGKTLIFTDPFAHPPASKTVTFSAATGYITPQEIKTQIQAVIPLVRVGWFEGRIVLREATPSVGVAITGAGTANPLLGFGPQAWIGHPYVWHTGVGAYKILKTIQAPGGLVVVTEE